MLKITLSYETLRYFNRNHSNLRELYQKSLIQKRNRAQEANCHKHSHATLLMVIFLLIVVVLLDLLFKIMNITNFFISYFIYFFFFLNFFVLIFF